MIKEATRQSEAPEAASDGGREEGGVVNQWGYLKGKCMNAWFSFVRVAATWHHLGSASPTVSFARDEIEWADFTWFSKSEWEKPAYEFSNVSQLVLELQEQHSQEPFLNVNMLFLIAAPLFDQKSSKVQLPVSSLQILQQQQHDRRQNGGIWEVKVIMNVLEIKAGQKGIRGLCIWRRKWLQFVAFLGFKGNKRST